ncbi:MAG: hypothetical protein KFB95_05745 [Simkaniaceae bacterium]|nr:MAG: hypothetical protein KFB95_05745 [Simkaniaceae bacterium]
MAIRFYPGENVHPSMLPENMHRTRLHQIFHQCFLPEIGSLLGKGSYFDPPSGYERAWRIFLGVNIEGSMHFICHIAENFSTGKGYNSGDFSMPNCPVLLYGEPFQIETSAMDLIRGEFPPHHQGKVPVQMTLAITPKTAPGYAHAGSLVSLLNGTATEIDTPCFTARKMTPTGTESLSFKTDDFPIEFWTHASRVPVIFTALQLEQAKASPDLGILNLYQQACALETALPLAIRSLEDKQIELDRETRSLLGIQNNTRIPAERKATVIAQKEDRIAILEGERDALADQAVVASEAINTFKLQYGAYLPNSYREATFQVAFDTTLPDGTTVHKQYNSETGAFEISDPARDVRFLDAVHNPYLHL